MREDGGERGRGQCGTFGYYLKNIIKFLISHIGLVTLVVGYTIVGAITFKKLEEGHEILVKRNVTGERRLVADDLWNITNNMPVLNETMWAISVGFRLQKFEKTLIRAIKKEGWDGNEDEKSLQWTLPGALFYSIILITTIGYGHIAPKTSYGKVVTIFYAIPGVPLMMLCLANIGDGMAHSFRFLYWKVCCYACTKRPKKKRRARSTRSSRRYPSHSGSTRTRASSFRRSNRASEKSADSHLSDSAFYTSSYSDPDYNTRMEEELPEADMRGLSRGRSSDHHHRGSQNSRGSEYLAPPPKEEDGRVAVLFNKYALENEDAAPDTPRSDDAPARPNGRDQEGRESGRRSRRDEEGDLSTVAQHSPRGHRAPLQPEYPDSPQLTRSPRSDRRSRHLPPPPDPRSRLSRLEEEYYYDDDYDDGYDEEDDDEDDIITDRPVPIWLGVMLVVGYIFGGAAFFARWEDWEFLDSVYFCFITLTTIGFGDFVPAQNEKYKDDVKVRIALCSVYLLFGIALLAMSFNLVQEEVITNVKSMAKRLGIIKEEDTEDDMD